MSNIEFRKPSSFQMRGSFFNSASSIVDWAASVCYARKMKETEEEVKEFLLKLVRMGHLEPFGFVSVYFTINKEVRDYFKIPDKFRRFIVLEYGVGCMNLRTAIEAVLEGGDSFFVDMCRDTIRRTEFSFLQEILGDCSVEQHVCGFMQLTPTGEQESLHPAFKHLERKIVLFTCSRNIANQLVRHRVASYCQESQRYCRYDEKVPVVIPLAIEQDKKLLNKWTSSVKNSAEIYQELLKSGAKPQTARGVLPGDTATCIAVCASKKEWDHIFKLRTSPKADPEMRRIMEPLAERFSLAK